MKFMQTEKLWLKNKLSIGHFFPSLGFKNFYSIYSYYKIDFENVYKVFYHVGVFIVYFFITLLLVLVDLHKNIFSLLKVFIC